MTMTPDLSKATDFIWRTARLLERRRFASLFLNGEQQAVLLAATRHDGTNHSLRDARRSAIPRPWSRCGRMDESTKG
jgi:hypothetical protein